MKFYVECGQRWWRWRSWVRYKYPGTTGYRGPTFRKLTGRGVAFGPLMLCDLRKRP